MTAADALLAARAFEAGHALRRTTLRHTRLSSKPFAISMWRLGGERFRAASVAWGDLNSGFQLAVAGEPRNRDLYFAGLLPFAEAFCDAVRASAREQAKDEKGRSWVVNPLQLVVPNRGTVEALGLLGRYLAYLSDRGGQTPPAALVEAGKHLRFYARHSRTTGQALIVALDRLLADHWATSLSPLELANLAVIDSQISPPHGLSPVEAAGEAERNLPVGPEPSEAIDRTTSRLIETFNDKRGDRTDPKSIKKLIGPVLSHYRAQTDPVWRLMARCWRRELLLTEAPSAERRWEADAHAFTAHANWVIDRGGRYRTRDDVRQAAMTLRRLEEAKKLFEAERALDDPAWMVPHLLDGTAVRGVVTKVDAAHKEQGPKLMVSRPRIVLEVDGPVSLPIGKRMWWTERPQGNGWEVKLIRVAKAKSQLTFQLNGPHKPGALPAAGTLATFSVLTTASRWNQSLAKDIPWPLQPRSEVPPGAIDAGDGETLFPAVAAEAVPEPDVYA